MKTTALIQKPRISRQIMRQLGAAATEGADEIELSAAEQKVLKGFARQVSTCFASLENLKEPFRGEFKKVKKDIDTVLAALPPSDQAPAALDANYLLRNLCSLLEYAGQMMDNMGNMMTRTRTLASADTEEIEEQVKTDVAKEVQRQLASGEYVKKADVETAKTTAASTAIAAERLKWKTELQLVASRKTLLTTASLPIPGDDVLIGDETAFNTLQTRAKNRFEKLKPFASKLKPERVLALAWNVDDTAFDATFADYESFGAPAAPAGGGHPFAGRAAAGAPAGGATATKKQEQRKKVGCM